MDKKNNNNIKYKKSLLEKVKLIDEYIRGKVNEDTGEREGGVRRRLKQNESKEERKMWILFNCIRKSIKKIDESELGRQNLTKEEEELIRIYEELIKDYPIREKNSMLITARKVDEYIRGKLNQETGEREGGIRRRPIRSAKEDERKIWWSLNNLQQKTKKLKEIKLNGEEITKEEEEIIRIYEELIKDYPCTKKRDILETVKEIDEYIRGEINQKTGEREGGLNRRPNTLSKDKKEKKMSELLSFVKQKIGMIKQRELEGETITEEEQEIIRIYEQLDSDYPVKQYRTLLDTAIKVDEYIRGKLNQETGEREGGIRRRPIRSDKDKTEKKMSISLNCIKQTVKNLKQKQKNGKLLTKEDQELIKIYDQISEEYPSLMEQRIMKREQELKNIQAKNLYEAYKILEQNKANVENEYII